MSLMPILYPLQRHAWVMKAALHWAIMKQMQMLLSSHEIKLLVDLFHVLQVSD